jgi:hypothetical protein
LDHGREGAGIWISGPPGAGKGLSVQAQVPDHEEFAKQWQILMMGSIIAAYAGDLDAARRTKAVGALLLARNGIDARPGTRK